MMLSLIHSILKISQKFLIKGSTILSTTTNLQTVESNISKELGKIKTRFKNYIDVGSYPFFRLGIVGVSVVLRSSNKKKLNLCKNEIKKLAKRKKIKIYN